jgi:hypothetical protein
MRPAGVSSHIAQNFGNNRYIPNPERSPSSDGMVLFMSFLPSPSTTWKAEKTKSG